MVNPHFAYAAAFTLALALYPLGWSSLYPDMSIQTVAFIGVTIGVHLIAGTWFMNRGFARPSAAPAANSKIACAITTGLYILWTAEFIYAGGIPLLEILLQRQFDYKVFGIPMLHVFVVTFASFYTILLFHQYLASGARVFLFIFLINLCAAILIYNRGMFLFNLAACGFLFLIHRRIRLAHIIVTCVGVVVILYLFGVMGSMRVSNESRISYSNEGFMTSGAATEAFRQSSIPPEYFWTYIYTTSPLANLQENITSGDEKNISVREVLDWINNEVFPDFISKRINHLTGSERVKIKTIRGPFNATTIYAGSFSQLGWWGLLFMAIVTLVAPWMYVKIVPSESPLFLSGWVILTTIFLFMIFENTLRFTGFSLQLAYPIVLTLALRRVKWRNRYFHV